MHFKWVLYLCVVIRNLTVKWLRLNPLFDKHTVWNEHCSLHIFLKRHDWDKGSDFHSNRIVLLCITCEVQMCIKNIGKLTNVRNWIFVAIQTIFFFKFKPKLECLNWVLKKDIQMHEQLWAFGYYKYGFRNIRIIETRKRDYLVFIAFFVVVETV